MQTVTLSQSANVVQAGVEADALATVTLQAAAGDGVTFQNRDALPLSGQYSGADEAAEATADNHHVAFHVCYCFFLVKNRPQTLSRSFHENLP